MGTRYETWRLCHGIGAGLIALFTLHHAIDAGRYSSQMLLLGFWVVLTGFAILALLQTYLIRPLFQLRHPYQVVSVKPVALKTWELKIEPVPSNQQQGKAMNFLPGQFVWLTLKCSPFAITEHPFSISSAPAERPRIGFTIKEMGDFTNTIGQIPIGSCAFIDGPHGHLVLEGRGDKGLVLIAGGSGLAPIMSMLRQLRADKDTRPIKLIYGNRIAEQILYREELDAMTRELNLQIDYILGEPPADWDGHTGQLNIDMLGNCLSSGECREWVYIICGPSPMIESVEGSLIRLGVSRRQIHSEKFTQL
jgi:predicted ferric reductase